MPRPHSEELRKSILAAFWKSFREEGYEAASYGRIAQELGVKKAVVQYHCPIKEQVAIAFMERLLDESADILNIETTPAGSDAFVNLYRLGQVYFAFLLQEDGYQLFLCDVIRSRDLTEAVLAFNTTRGLEFAGYATAERPEHSELSAVDHSVIVNMGGFYELLYHCLKNDRPFDVRAELYSVLEGFIDALGYDQSQTADLLASGTMSDTELATAVSTLNERLSF